MLKVQQTASINRVYFTIVWSQTRKKGYEWKEKSLFYYAFYPLLMQKMGMFQTVPFWIAKAEYLIIHLGMQRECFNGSAGADRERAVDTWMPRYWVKKQEGFNWYRITVNVCLELAGLYQKMANRWVVMWTADVRSCHRFVHTSLFFPQHRVKCNCCALEVHCLWIAFHILI